MVDNNFARIETRDLNEVLFKKIFKTTLVKIELKNGNMISIDLTDSKTRICINGVEKDIIRNI